MGGRDLVIAFGRRPLPTGLEHHSGDAKCGSSLTLGAEGSNGKLGKLNVHWAGDESNH